MAALQVLALLSAGSQIVLTASCYALVCKVCAWPSVCGP